MDDNPKPQMLSGFAVELRLRRAYRQLSTLPEQLSNDYKRTFRRLRRFATDHEADNQQLVGMKTELANNHRDKSELSRQLRALHLVRMFFRAEYNASQGKDFSYEQVEPELRPTTLDPVTLVSAYFEPIELFGLSRRAAYKTEFAADLIDEWERFLDRFSVWAGVDKPESAEEVN